jgi:DegV family protein with EDD domain
MTFSSSSAGAVPASTKFLLVTDSTCDLGQAELQRLGIASLPLTVHLQGQKYRDWSELDPDALYGKMKGGHQATTSPPTTEAFAKVYEDLIRSGKPVLSIHLSGSISDTVEHARRAALQLEMGGLVTVVDSGVASAGLAEFVLLAARIQARGGTLAEAVAALHALKGDLFSEFVVPDLEYLRRGGRLSRAGLLLGNLTGLRPVLAFEQGRIVPRRRVRMQQAEGDLIQRLVEHAQGRPVAVTIFHAGRDQPRLQELQSAIKRSKLQVARGRVQLIGCVIGAHTGPGAYGFIVVPMTLGAA